MRNEYLGISALTADGEEIKVLKNKIGDERIKASSAYSILKDQLLPEGSARQNLATFCQTQMEAEAQRIISETLDRNAIDRSLYLQTADIEDRCVEMIADLWHRPQSGSSASGKSKPKGTSTIGSSEGCMLGGLAMKKRWEAWAEKNLGRKKKKPNLIITSAYQVCWEKFAAYWDVELRIIPVDEDHLALNTDQVGDKIDKYTIGVVCILGLTYTGLYDDIKAVSKIVEEYNEEGQNEVYIHVDAASGGLLEPFLNPDFEWDFRVKNVVSINVSGHKYGLVYPGIGWVIWRDEKYIPDDMVFEVSYLGEMKGTISLNFSKSASQIIGQYYNFIRYGKNGYRDIHQLTFDISVYITQEIAGITIERNGIQIPVFKIINDKNIKNGDIDYKNPNYKPVRIEDLEDAVMKQRAENFLSQSSDDMDDVTRQPRLPLVCWKLSDEVEKVVNWNTNDFADRLLMRGWQTPVYPLSADLENIYVQRIVCRADMSIELAKILVQDIKNAVKHLDEKYSAGNVKKENEAFGFTH